MLSATATNADITGRPELGLLDEGTPADIVIFAGNPLEATATLWAGPRLVVKAGACIQ